MLSARTFGWKVACLRRSARRCAFRPAPTFPPTISSTSNAAQKRLRPGSRLLGQLVWEQREPMRAARINREFRLVARRHPPGVHEQRVVEQRILGPDAEQRRTQTFQVSIER